MACTKQTPRNPVLERPLAAMGIDVQERRVPSKLATKKIPNRYHSGLLALREIRRYQQSTESLI